MLALGKLLELTLAGREPSEKIQVCASGARLRWRAEGVLQIDPPADCDRGVDLLLSAGIHGDEVAPVGLLERLLHDIASCRLLPSVRLLLVLGNPAALRRGVRFVGYDLNRLFGAGVPSASGPEAMRVVELSLQAELFFAQPARRRLHYDLHSSLRTSLIEPFALCPSGAAPPSRSRLMRLQAAGVRALLLQSGSSATISAFTASRFGAEAFALVLGASGAGEDSLESLLRALIEGRELPAAGDCTSLQLFAVEQEIVRHGDGFRLYLDDTVANFTELAPGTLLAEDAEGHSWRVGAHPARILFACPRVGKGLRAGLVVVPVALEELGS